MTVFLNLSLSPIMKKQKNNIARAKHNMDIIDTAKFVIHWIPIKSGTGSKHIKPIAENPPCILLDKSISSLFSLSGNNPEIISQATPYTDTNTAIAIVKPFVLSIAIAILQVAKHKPDIIHQML